MKRLPPLTIIPDSLYVEREADRQLRRNLAAMGRPAYILVARQMGKTNLLLHAKRTLQQADDLFVYLDLSKPFETARECFRLIIDNALEQRAEFPLSVHETIHKDRSLELPAYREHEKELRVLLKNITGKLVITLDEIDSLTKTAFSDAIFAQIRSSYFERTNIKEFERLTYVLSGVVEPNNIIKDKRISPFNIGEEIYLEDFSRSELGALLNTANLEFSTEVADRIYYWTRGNPRMTWDVSSALEDAQACETIGPATVDTLVSELYLADFNRAPIDHMRELLTGDPELRSAVRALQTAEAPGLTDTAKRKLYLAGIVAATSRKEAVSIKCPIIGDALGVAWIDEIAGAAKSALKTAQERLLDKNYGEALRLYETAELEGLTNEDS